MALFLVCSLADPGLAAGVLETVQSRGELSCGVIPGEPGAARQGDDRRWQGFDADFCRAFAAAALGDAAAVVFVPLAADEARKALADGTVHVLARGRYVRPADGQVPVRFVTFTFVDAQSFLVPAESRVRNAMQLDGARVCVPKGTTAAANLASFGRSAEIRFEPLVVSGLEALGAALEEGGCEAASAGRLDLAMVRQAMAAPAAEYEILPEVLSREQTGPLVGDGDPAWVDLVKWTVFTLIQAEELGITRDGVEGLRASSKDPRVRRFLGVEGELGAALGVRNDWTYLVIKAVGSYGEIYDRHLGPDTPLGLERGPNALWSDGGLLHAMPFQ